METNFITKYIPDKVLNKIEKALVKVSGASGERSIFQKAADAITGWKPNAQLLNITLKIIKTIFRIPNLTTILLDAYRRAASLQIVIDAGDMTPEEAGKTLRDDVKQNRISQTLGVPGWLVNFLCEGVVLAIKILKSQYMK